jgi:hypothetical protein
MLVKLQDKAILRNDPEQFAGRVAVVTGAGSGIGRAAALAFGCFTRAQLRRLPTDARMPGWGDPTFG